jgi:hypothetical protein
VLVEQGLASIPGRSIDDRLALAFLPLGLMRDVADVVGIAEELVELPARECHTAEVTARRARAARPAHALLVEALGQQAHSADRDFAKDIKRRFIFGG